MTCQHPLTLKSKGKGWQFSPVVPCGRCPACRVNRAEEWASRMVWESDYFRESCFMTLTYSDENLPLDRSVSKDVLQRFVKRLRKAVGRQLKYFGCGEYGSLTSRPHYHLVVFGLSAGEQDIVLRAWGLGNVSCSVFTAGRALYCAGYLLKEVDAKFDMVGCTKPFALMSKKLGRRFMLENAVDILAGKPLTRGGSPVAVPRYFRKLLDLKGADPDFLAESRRVHLQRVGPWRGPVSGLDLLDSLQSARDQVAENLAGLLRVKKEKDNGL